MHNACVSLNATPQPANSLNGYLLSFLLQSTTASASGISSPGSWWSVITISIPNSFAYFVSSIAVIPQSTVIIRFVPSSDNFFIAFLFRPYPSFSLFGM